MIVVFAGNYENENELQGSEGYMDTHECQLTLECSAFA